MEGLTMSKNRKDLKGRVLKTGESQRKDGSYQYRYQDNNGNRRTVYAKTLNELRDKEKIIIKDLEDGIDSFDKVTTEELIDKYLLLKSHLKRSTVETYKNIGNVVKRCAISKKVITSIKQSDAKQCVIELYSKGLKYSTVMNIHTWMKAVFEMAYQDDLIRKNPFKFKLSTVLKKDSTKKEALSKEEENELIAFLRKDSICSKYYDEIILLLNTGLRASELCGLTVNDLDFKGRTISINKQIQKSHHGEFYIQSLKTESSLRTIPMTDLVYHSLLNVLSKDTAIRKDYHLEGYSGFLFFNPNTKVVKTRCNLEYMVRTIIRRHNKRYPDNPLPSFTPHTLRHTFCTRLVLAGATIKDVQYLMGHSDCSTTLEIYSHSDAAKAAQTMLQVMNTPVPYMKLA